MDSLFLLSGDDDYSKNEYLDKLKESFGELKKGINFLQFDKDNISFLSNELDTYTFFAESKFIIVKVPKNKKQSEDELEEQEEEIVQEKKTSSTAWLTEDMEELIKEKSDSTVLVFVEEGTSSGKLFKLVSKYGRVVTFKKQKAYELTSWVTAYVLSKGKSITKYDAEYLMEVCGSDKRNISNEVEKLLSYCEGDKITKADIDVICTINPETIIFDLTDSLGAKNKKKALQSLDRLLSGKEPIQKILIMITNSFQKLIITKECLNQGKSLQNELDAHPFVIKKYTEQTRNFTLEELIKIFKELVKLDINSKLSNIDINVGLQKIIMQ